MKTLNYSLRYLLKNRGNSLTRLVSLALGLIVALLICSYVGINLSYGRFFPNRERVYMMFEKSAQFGISKAMLQPMAPTLAEVIPQIEAATHHFDRLMQIKVGDIPVDYRYLNVGSDFFTVLDFGVISGDPKRILSDEGLANNEVMISERLATTLFGNNAPLGKILTTTRQIVEMLNLRYVWIVGGCFVVAAPVAWQITSRWLEQFANRIAQPWWLYIVALAVVLAVTVGLVTLRSWKAATENPADVVKSN